MSLTEKYRLISIKNTKPKINRVVVGVFAPIRLVSHSRRSYQRIRTIIPKPVRSQINEYSSASFLLLTSSIMTKKGLLLLSGQIFFVEQSCLYSFLRSVTKIESIILKM